MVTTRFAYICRPFAQGLLDKTRALNELEFNKHQRARLRESISVDVRKLCDMLIPDARHPQVSVAAAEQAAAIGVDLRQETWHSQTRFDPKRAVFHYEHMNPVSQIVNALAYADSVGAIVQILSDGLRLAWITKDEDAQLTALGYRHKRPDPGAAYAEAGVVLLPPLPDPGHDRSDGVSPKAATG
ncbi:hypothetical protein OOK58_42865 [Streptomyces sp. NBC_01728]|uniref:hypothetical protein n=1 Tax=unclassified Streptomyces TaxID=2593676 RepID=UPI0022550189|nr:MULTISPECIES: hypothetical protein [unclassified Streptomyces]MCX4458654.1 hypothetical protein [Streptomyces sp. NBC_01719]MCX4498011.1 hypothetical protein [Streptomyces sp. NBC_01728]